MSVDRLTRVNALLKREIGNLLFRVVHDRAFDVAAVTVTRVETSKDLRDARVFVSIRDHQDERPRMLALLARHRGELQARISRALVLKYTPRLAFEIDTSIEEGDRVLAMLARLEQDDAAPSA